MRLPQLQIRQTYAQLGLTIHKPIQEIQQPKAELNLRQEPAILEIKQPSGVLTIDTSEAQANMDLRGPIRRTSDNAQYGYEKAMEAIAQISQEGDRLRAIEHKGKPIPDIAFEESIMYQNNYTIDRTIGDGIEIRYEARKPEINVQVRGVRLDPVIHRPIHHYTPGKVEGYIKQWNSISFDVIGLQIDRWI